MRGKVRKRAKEGQGGMGWSGNSRGLLLPYCFRYCCHLKVLILLCFLVIGNNGNNKIAIVLKNAVEKNRKKPFPLFPLFPQRGRLGQKRHLFFPHKALGGEGAARKDATLCTVGAEGEVW